MKLGEIPISSLGTNNAIHVSLIHVRKTPAEVPQARLCGTKLKLGDN